MKRILLGCIAVVVIVVIGLALFISANADKIGAALSGAVERATGRPLVLAEPPRLSFFPRPGISLGEAAWGNEKDDLYVTIKGGTVRVALLPLFRGRVDMEAVRLDTPRIMVDLAGRRAGGTPLPPAASEGRKAPPSTPSGGAGGPAFALPDVSLARLDISEGFVRLKDADATTEVRGLALTASDLGPGREGSLAVEGEFSRKDSAANAAETRVAFKLETLLRPEAAGIRLNGLAARLVPAGRKEELSLATTGPLSFDPASETLTADGLDLVLTSGGKPLFTARAGGSIRPGVPAGELTAQLEGSPKALLDVLGVAVTTRDPAALTALSASARLAFTPAEYRLSKFRATLDGTPLSGGATLVADGKAPLSVTAQLTAGDVNVDRYLPAGRSASPAPGSTTDKVGKSGGSAAGGGTPAGQAGTSRPQWPSVDLRLAVNRIVVSDVRLDKLNARLTGAAGTYSLNPCAFTLYEGQAALTAGVHLAATPPRYALDLKSSNVRLGALLKAAAHTDNVDGRVGLAAKLGALGPATPQGDLEAAIRRSLNGSGSLEGRDLVVKAGLVPTGAPGGAGRADSFTFSRLTGSFTAVNGRVSLRDFTLTGRGVGATAAGTIDLPADQMAVNGVVQLAKLGIPITISGPLNKPSYGLDTPRMLQNTVEGMLRGGSNAGGSARDAGKALKHLLGL